MLNRAFRHTSKVFRRLGSRQLYAWSREEAETETLAKIPPASEIIREGEIHDALERTAHLGKDKEAVRAVLERAKERALLKHLGDEEQCGHPEFVQGLTVGEAAVLLNADSKDDALMQDLFDTALAIKRRIYGNRVVLFAPLYLANSCMNTCTYCAFQAGNKGLQRSAVTESELIAEVEALERIGHRRLLVLTGESPAYSYDRFLSALKTIKDVKTEPAGEIRRVNVEIPPLSISDYRKLLELDIVGTVTLFQETYHRETYKRYHTAGPKADYDYRLQTMDRANLGGIDDVGIGALFGLYDYRFEVLAMLQHSEHLEKYYGAGPHTISFPRMQPADGAPLAEQPPYPVNDADFRKLVAVIRCAVPYTGMILSTRESPEMRRDLLHLGVSQLSAGSKTDVGAYHRDAGIDPSIPNVAGAPQLTEEEEERAEISKRRRARRAASSTKPKHDAGQFELQDHRTLDEVVAELMKEEFQPSWCTACYRSGRQGKAFEAFSRSGKIGEFCSINATLSTKEWLEDYATPETKTIGDAMLEKELENVEREGTKRLLERKLGKIAKGERDLYV